MDFSFTLQIVSYYIRSKDWEFQAPMGHGAHHNQNATLEQRTKLGT
jgi:hypothetical protein